MIGRQFAGHSFLENRCKSKGARAALMEVRVPQLQGAVFVRPGRQGRRPTNGPSHRGQCLVNPAQGQPSVSVDSKVGIVLAAKSSNDIGVMRARAGFDESTTSFGEECQRMGKLGKLLCTKTTCYWMGVLLECWFSSEVCASDDPFREKLSTGRNGPMGGTAERRSAGRGMLAEGNGSDILMQAISGDRAALKLLLTNSYSGLLSYTARKMPLWLRGQLDAEDIVQDTHVRVFRNIGTFSPRDATSFDRWIRTIALRRLRDVIKSHRTAKRGGLLTLHPLQRRTFEDSALSLLDLIAAPGRTASRSVSRLEAVDAIQDAIDDLPEHYRKAVWMVHIEGRSVAETAGAMGRTNRAIHGLCRRGLVLMRDRLESAGRFLSSSC